MANFTELGFRLVSKRPCTITGDPGESPARRYVQIPGTNRYVQFESAADARAIPPSGLFPATDWRYRVYAEVLPSGNDPTAVAYLSVIAATATRGVPMTFLDVQIEESSVVFAVIAFQAADVIDLGEDGFERVSDGIQVPQNIFKVIHAGAEPLVPEGDDKGIQFWTTVGPYLPSNLSKGTTLNINAPWDVQQQAEQEQREVFADTSSNVISVSNPSQVNYVSYVAMADPLFRDVVVLEGQTKKDLVGAVGSLFETTGRQALTPVRPFVLRYAWNDSLSQWVLSESYNFKPRNVAATPEGVEQGANDLSTHFLYNVEEADFPETRGILPGSIRINKTAYPPWVARDKLDEDSKNFDPRFKSGEIPQDNSAEVIPGDPEDLSQVLLSNDAAFFPTGGLLGSLSSESPGCAGTFGFDNNHSYVYTSPKFLADVPSAFRVAAEYYSSYRLGRISPVFEGATFVRSTNVGSLGANFDRSTQSTDIIRSTSAGFLQKRRVIAARWTRSRTLPEAEGTGFFILGEFPYKTSGGSIFTPESSDEDIASDGEIDLPKGKLPVSIGLKVRKGRNGIGQGTFRLFLKGSENPSMEISLHDVTPSSNGIVRANVEPEAYARYETGGGFLGVSFVEVADENSTQSGALTPPPMNESDKKSEWIGYSNSQIDNLTDITWPSRGQNVTTVFDDPRGTGYMAYDLNGRIDLGIKPPELDSYLIVRDVTLRFPGSSSDEEGGSAFPDADLPGLAYDSTRRQLHLFYAYKGSLLVKNIHASLLDGMVKQGGGIPPEEESLIIRKMHKVSPWVVYKDWALSPEIQEDVDKRFVYHSSLIGQFDPDRLHVEAHSAFVEASGRAYCLVQNKGRMEALRSDNGCRSWSNVFGEGRLFVHPSEGGENLEEQASFPYLMYDRATHSVSLFFFVENSLMLTQFPASILRQQPDQALRSFSAITPVLLFGVLTEEMEERGIIRVREETTDGGADSEGEEESAIPMRIGSVITQQGNYRVFFVDSSNNLRSLTSSTSGDSWRPDENFKPKEREAEEEGGFERTIRRSDAEGQAGSFYESDSSRVEIERRKQIIDSEEQVQQDGYYYHVLPAGDLGSVMEHGLSPGRPAFMEDSGKLFLTDIGGVSSWKRQVKNYYGYDIPVAVIRIRKSNVPDASRDETGFYYVTRTIEPGKLEIVER